MWMGQNQNKFNFFGKKTSAKKLQVLRQKTSKQKPESSRQVRKSQKRKDPQNSWPQKTVWVRGRKSRTRNCYLEPEPQRKNQTQHAPRILMPTCCTSYVRDWRKRRRYATRADRLVLRQSVRRIESMAPSASLILLTLRFDRQVTASSAKTDRATQHVRYRKPFF